ncbi:MAG: dTMP kinase [Pseudomonadota bacterium]
MTGRFITLEGGEGTGKSTLIAGLNTAFRARGISAVVTREPGGTPLAEAARTLVLHPPEGEAWSPLAEALLMNAARVDHLERQIRPALRGGLWVVCDRFSDSTLAYQSVGGVSLPLLRQLESLTVGDTRPDLTLVLDAAPEALQPRRIARQTRDAFEDKALSFHHAVRERFLEIAKAAPERCVVIDALQTPEAILSEALELIEKRLGWPV